MKTQIYSLLLILLGLFGATGLKAQAVDMNNKHNYVVLTQKVPQLQPILLTAESLMQENSDSFGDFQVIICGKEIVDITDPEKMKDFIIMAEKAGVQLVACGFSLSKFNVDRSKVPKEIKIVDNGILYNFQLQDKGYKSLSL